MNAKRTLNKRNRLVPHALALLLSVAATVEALAFDHSHSIWTEILRKNVQVQNGGKTSSVNYTAIKKDPKNLNEYLRSLTSVKKSDFSQFSKENQIAFLINVYNAFMVSLVVENLPIKSVKELGIPFVGPWKKSFITVFGKKYSLDDIEHGILRKDYVEPRIHFGVNCASLSCPPLRAEAFVGSKLGHQLDEQAKLFFSNESENSFDPVKKSLRLNPILKWFNGDFSKSGDAGTVEYVAKYLPMLNATLSSGKAKANEISVEYGNYNWDLNGL